MFRVNTAVNVLVIWLLLHGATAHAGMPSALPEDFSRVFRLSETGSGRLQAISFFLLGLAVVSLAVMGLWNYLR